MSQRAAARREAVPPFENGLHLSPYALFRRLLAGSAPRLVDVRTTGGRATFEGADRWAGGAWPFGAGDALLFDDDGLRAASMARTLQAEGLTAIRALYGGLRLYDHALDPVVVGRRRFLVAAA